MVKTWGAIESETEYCDNGKQSSDLVVAFLCPKGWKGRFSDGDSFIDELSRYIQDTFPGIKGFNRRGLYRMKQFYEAYANHERYMLSKGKALILKMWDFILELGRDFTFIDEEYKVRGGGEDYATGKTASC